MGVGEVARSRRERFVRLASSRVPWGASKPSILAKKPSCFLASKRPRRGRATSTFRKRNFRLLCSFKLLGEEPLVGLRIVENRADHAVPAGGGFRVFELLVLLHRFGEFPGAGHRDDIVIRRVEHP